MATAPAQVFGQLKAFDPEKENISTYLERVELYFAASVMSNTTFRELFPHLRTRR